MTAFPPAFLIDLDGTVYNSSGAIPGALEAVASLRRRGIPFRFVSNTSGKPRSHVLERLRGYGIPVAPHELINPVIAGASLMRGMGVRRVAPFVRQVTHEDLQEFELVGGTSGRPGGTPDAVLVGDMGDDWSHALLNEAFRYLLDGLPLIALERDRYWLGPTGLELDAGPYVVALEYASGVQSTVCGKPTRTFYEAALSSMGLSLDAADRPAMVGDDVWSDVDGAQKAGLQGWLVKTGKYLPDVLEKTGVKPDRIIDSIAALA